MKKRIIVILILPMLFLQINCGSKTSAIVSVAGILIDAFVNFDEIANKINEIVTSVTTETKEELNSIKEVEGVPDIAENWESSWNNIDSKIQDLEEEFNNIEEQSQKYFNAMIELENNTTDQSLVDDMISKRKIKEEQYILAKANASNEILNLKDMLRVANDFHNSLMHDFLITKIDNNIFRLDKISYEAKLICNRLSQFKSVGFTVFN